MNTNPSNQSLVLEPNDTRSLATLCGPHDEHLRQIESRLGVRIHNRGNHFRVDGPEPDANTTVRLLQSLYQEVRQGRELTRQAVHLNLQQAGLAELPAGVAERVTDGAAQLPSTQNAQLIQTRKALIKPRGLHQREYVQAIGQHDINFGIGPAGTGKTYLAVACAVAALESERVERILLVRPAVEAGEKLGFLPGDLAQKIDPYLRPLYDALWEMLGFDLVSKLIERNIIEIAPLAFMRGRTLNNAFIILDESQNTTSEQMKMFLTRIGFGSTAVITGDITQVDLPRSTRSGLVHTTAILEGVAGISFTQFDSRDVVRHPLVQRIVEAYERHDARGEDTQGK